MHIYLISAATVALNTNLTDETNVISTGAQKYSAMLINVDINTNKNSFFKLQLLKTNQIVETKGRIGTSIGETNIKHYTTLVEAQRIFKNTYFEMTGNEFDSPRFEKMPGKYFPLQIDTDILKRKIKRNSAPTKLTAPLYQLLELLFDDKVMTTTLIAFYLDLHTMPLGKISQHQVQQAIDHLINMSSILSRAQSQSSNNINGNQIIAASNQLYSLFPHDFGVRRPLVINTPELAMQKLKMLQHMLQKEHTFEILTSDLNEEVNLLDKCYEHLTDSAEIKMLNKLSGMYTQICTYVQNTQLRTPGHSTFEVEEIFQVTRHEEVLRYAPYEDNFNRQLLFHVRLDLQWILCFFFTFFGLFGLFYHF